MKFNKLMFAALAMGAMMFVACDKKPDEPVGPVGPGGGGDDPTPAVEEAPEVAAPADGYVTFVIQIPEGSECNGIALKGTLDGAAWSGENTYVSETKADASKDECIKFQKVDGTKTWFKATFKLGPEGFIEGKICLIYTNDGSWQGQAVNWEVNEEFTTVDWENTGNLKVTKSGLIYVKIGGWQGSECATLVDYKITVLVPAFCGEEFPIELIGSFNGWSDEGTVALTKVEGNKFEGTIKATENAEWKVRGKGNWDQEIQGYIDDEKSEKYDTWDGVPNNVLGKDVNVTVDYSDAAKYRWKGCE